MFSPSINVDLEKLKESEEKKPSSSRARRVAPRRGTPARKPAAPQSESEK